MAKDLNVLDERELSALWDAYVARRMWFRAIERGADRSVAERAIAELPYMTAVDALKANHLLADLLVGRRWYVMQDAREAGATWDEIGLALGISQQEAYEWYRQRIAEREKLVPDFHDAQRARAAL